MTKALEIVGIDYSKNALEWAKEVLRVRFEEVLALSDNALNSQDIEGVHEMRVASRRLRSALRDFSPLMKSTLLKEFRKELKQIADKLGQARDDDVVIAALEKLRNRAKNENVRNDIEKKIEKLRTRRAKMQNELVRILADSSLESLNKKFAKAIEQATEKNDKFSKLTAHEAGQKVLSNGLQEFCNLSESLYKPFNQTKLHELRISAKRLRYAIELFTACWGERIQPFAKEISDMQTYLGELHDSDIWIENLSQRLSKKPDKKETADFWLLSKFTKKRTQNYRAALRLWGKWQRNNFLKRLQDVLQKD